MSGEGPLVTSSRPVWLSSLLFSLLALAGIWFFASPAFSWLLLLAGIAHVVVVVWSRSRGSLSLFYSQSLIVIATIGSVFGYLLREVGPVQGVPKVLLEFLLVPWTRQGFMHFATYLVGLVGLVAGLVLLLAWRGQIPRMGFHLVAPSLYAASAVNVARDYAFQRPLRSISISPEAHDVIFAYGLAALEFALLLHALGCVFLALVSFLRRGALRDVMLTPG